MKTETRSIMFAFDAAQSAATAQMRPVAVVATLDGYATLPLTTADTTRIAKLQAANLPAEVVSAGIVCPVVGIARVTQPGTRWN